MPTFSPAVSDPSFRSSPAAAALGRSDAAAAAGLAEADFVAAHAGFAGDRALTARRLRPRRQRIAAALAGFGAARGVVGHRACRVERVGPAVSPRRWAEAWALEQRGADGSVLRSVQFFDAAGHGVAEYAPGDARGVVAWLDLVEDCAAVVEPAPARRRVRPPPSHPGPAAWRGVRGAPALAQRLPATSAHELLGAAAQLGVAVLAEVPGAGVCGGDWRAVRLAGHWTQAESGRTRLHWREDAVAEAWLLRRPSARGLCQTLWLLDGDGAPVVRFGHGGGDAPEGCGWRRLVELVAAEADA